MKDYITRVADEICHEIDPSFHPADGREELYNIYAVLAYAKGVHVTNKDVHDAWAAWATKYYPDDEALIPYNMLTAAVQDEDTKYADAIKKVAARHSL